MTLSDYYYQHDRWPFKLWESTVKTMTLQVKPTSIVFSWAQGSLIVILSDDYYQHDRWTFKLWENTVTTITKQIKPTGFVLAWAQGSLSDNDYQYNRWPLKVLENSNENDTKVKPTGFVLSRGHPIIYLTMIINTINDHWTYKLRENTVMTMTIK